MVDRSAEIALLNFYVPGMSQRLQGRPVAATLHLTGCAACLASVGWTGSWSAALLGAAGVAAWSLLDALWYERRRRRVISELPAWREPDLAPSGRSESR